VAPEATGLRQYSDTVFLQTAKIPQPPRLSPQIDRGNDPGFAGIDNPLYYLDKTLMLSGDAKGFVGNIVRELSGSGAHGCHG